MNSPISNSLFKHFNSYNDFLLSKNICLILQQKYGIEEISPQSLLLLTKTLSNYIEELSHKIRNCTELAGREESNIIDILFTLLLKNNKSQKNITSYIEQKLAENENNYNINEYIDVKKLNEDEEKRRINYLEELNCIHVPHSNCINKSLLNVIPKNLRYFPREFSLKYSENILEKKNLEGIISGNGYYDINQKNKNEKGYINLLNIYNEIVKELGHNLSQNNDNEIKTSTELFGPKFYLRKFQDDHKDNEAENKGLGDNNINNNNDNVLGHGLYDNVKM